MPSAHNIYFLFHSLLLSPGVGYRFGVLSTMVVFHSFPDLHYDIVVPSLLVCIIEPATRMSKRRTQPVSRRNNLVQHILFHTLFTVAGG